MDIAAQLINKFDAALIVSNDAEPNARGVLGSQILKQRLNTGDMMLFLIDVNLVISIYVHLHYCQRGVLPGGFFSLTACQQ